MSGGFWSAARPVGRALRVGLVGSVFCGAVALHVPLCIFAIVTRLPCPGCGLTRATVAIASGHLAEGLALHPLAPIISPLVIAAMAYNAYSYVTRGKWDATEGLRARWMSALAVLLIAGLFVVWIARFFGAFGGPAPV